MVNLKKIITGLLAATTILFAMPIGASAEWRQNNIGWWYSEGSNYSIGWKQIDQKWYYFDGNGYMNTGWVIINGYWYYFYDNGAMASNVTVPGGAVGSDGRWIATGSNATQSGEQKNLFPEGSLKQSDPNAVRIHEWYGRNELSNEHITMDDSSFKMSFELDKNADLIYTAKGTIELRDTDTRAVLKSIKFDDTLTNKDLKDGYYQIVKDGLTIRFSNTSNPEILFLGKDLNTLGILAKG